MLNPSLDAYKEQHSKFVSIVVEYHNRHQDFVNTLSEASATDCRRMLRQLRALEKEMIPNIWDAFLINKKGMKEFKRLQRELKAVQKRSKPPIKNPRKEIKNESDISSSSQNI